MKVSKRTEYGLRAIVTLAELSAQGTRPVPLREIATLEDIPEAFLDQIFGTLRKYGIVNSIRGASGGYQLAMSPETIRMGQVVKILEGSVAPIGCVGEDRDSILEFCFKADKCQTRNVWLKLYQAIEKALDGLSLSDVIEQDLGVTN
nr:Rrf2 family transcriptional regulator [Bacilli bacterium]